MDICESEKAALRKKRLMPSVLAEKNNGTTGRSRIREVSSRYRSPSPSAPSIARRCPSPNVTRTSASTVSVPKRAISAERKRLPTPSRQSRPSSPSTPVHGSVAEALLATKKLEGLWPTTMRSLSVSFQSDTFSLPVGKREKPPPQALPDRTLRSSANITRKQGETTPGSRKPTPERKRSPLKGKVLVDQAENSRPIDSLSALLVDHHRWPTRTALTRSIDLSDRTNRVMPSTRRLSLDGAAKPLQKSSSDLLMLMSSDDNLIERMSSTRTRSLPSSVSRPQSPNKASSSCRGVSPSRIKLINAVPSRGSSPSRVRPSSPSKQFSSTASVLSFIVDVKKGRKAANHIEDAHQLRLLYNRHLQWLYANARADAVSQSQKVKAEKILYNVWRTLSEMRDSLIAKRIELQQLILELKLYLALSEQLRYLDQWAFMENEHMSSLSLTIQDLKDCTLRLPVACGARGDIESVKTAVCSAVDIMQSMGSSICSLLSPVEGVNCFMSELADVASQQRAVLDECEALFASTAALQVEEYSLRANLIQLRQSLQPTDT